MFFPPLGNRRIERERERKTMFRFCLRRLQEQSASSQFQYRKLNPGALLTVIRSEPGESADYYAKLYFGPGSESKVKHFLWNDLKRFGHVAMERDGPLEPPRWFPNHYNPPKAPQVRFYKAEEWDLSVLKQMDTDMSESQEVDVERAVSEEVGKKSKWGDSSSKPMTVSGGKSTQEGTSKEWEKDLEELVGEAVSASQEASTDGSDTSKQIPSSSSSSSSSTPHDEAQGLHLGVSFAARVNEDRPVVKELLRLVTLKPGREMTYYINLLETEEERSHAPGVFKELRTKGIFQRDPSPAGEGFVWSCIAAMEE